jgi:hypothetical protein
MKLLQQGPLLLLLLGSTQAWITPSRHDTSGMIRPTPIASSSSTRLYGFLDSLSPYQSKIPEELKDEIFAAEANTPAAQERGKRVGLYAAIAFVGIFAAFFNGFLTELRTSGADGSAGVDLSENGFGWVVDNFLFSFLFLNKIGGVLCLLGGAGSGLLAEAELDTKRINAEKIFEELERRRDGKTKKKGKKSAAPASASSGKKKRRSGKEAKRLAALSEIVDQEKESTKEPEVIEPVAAEETPVEEAKNDENKGIMGSLKDFYGKADNMAASQALLMNKKLEDVGVVEKITDETGLKVIGREEAAKLQEKKEAKDEKKDK